MDELILALVGLALATPLILVLVIKGLDFLSGSEDDSDRSRGERK